MNVDGVLVSEKKDYLRCCPMVDVDKLQGILNEDTMHWKSKLDRVLNAPKRVKDNVNKFLAEQQRQLEIFMKSQ